MIEMKICWFPSSTDSIVLLKQFGWQLVAMLGLLHCLIFPVYIWEICKQGVNASRSRSSEWNTMSNQSICCRLFCWLNESVWIMLDCNLALNLSFACPRPVGSSWGTRSKGAQNSSRDIRHKEIRSLARAWNIWNDTRSKSPICLPLGHWSLNRWDQCSPISGFLFTTSGPANLNSASRSRGPTRSTAETCQNIKNNLKYWSLTVQSMLACNRSESNNVQSELLSRTNCSQVKSFLLSSQLEMISSLVGIVFFKAISINQQSASGQSNYYSIKAANGTVGDAATTGSAPW